MDEIGDGARGGKLLRAGDDDAVVALLDHPGIEGRIALLVRRLAAVDLRRHDGVARHRGGCRACARRRRPTLSAKCWPPAASTPGVAA